MVFINYFVILVFCISSILAKYQIEVSEKNNGIQTIIRGDEYKGPLCDDSKPCREGFHCEKWNGNSFGTCKAVVSRHGLKEIHGITADRIRNEYTGPLCDDSKPCREGFHCEKWNGNSFGTCKAVVSRHGLKEIHGITADRIRNEYTGPLCDDSKPCREGFHCEKWNGNSFGTCKAVVSRHGLKEIHGITADRIRNEYTGPLCDDSKPCREGFHCEKWNGNSFGTCKAVVSRHGLKEIHGITADRIRNEYTGPLCDDSKPCREGFHCEKWNGNSFGTCKAVVSRHGLKEIHGITADRIRNEYTGPLCDDSKPCREGFHCEKWNGNSFGTCKAVVSRHGLKEIHGITADRIRNEYTGPLCDDSKPCREGFHCEKWNGNSFGTCKAVVSRHGLKEIHGITADRIRNEYTGPLCDDSKPCNEGFYCKKWNGNSFGTCKAVVSRHGLKEIHGITADRIRNEYTGPLCDDSKPCREGFHCEKWNGNSFGTCKAVVSRHGLKEIHGITADRIRNEYTGPLCDDSKPCREGFHCEKWNGNSFGTCKAVVSRHGLKEIHGITADRIRNEYTGPLCDDSKPCREGFHCEKWNGNSFGTCKAVVSRHGLKEIHGITADRIRNEYTGPLCDDSKPCREGFHCEKWNGNSFGTCKAVVSRHGLKEIHGITADRIRNEYTGPLCDDSKPCREGFHCEKWNGNSFGTCKAVVSRHGLKEIHGITADRIRNEYTGPLCDDSKPCNEGFYCKKWNGNSFGTCKAVVSRHGLKEIHGITADRIRNEYTGPLCDDSKPCREGFHCEKWNGNSFGTCKAVVSRHGLKEIHGITADRIRNEYTGPLCDDSKPCNEGFYCKKWNGNSFGTCKAVVRRLVLNDGSCKSAADCPSMHMCNILRGKSSGSCLPVSVRRLAQKDSVCNSNDDCNTGETCVFQNLGYYGVCVNVPVSRHSLKRNYGITADRIRNEDTNAECNDERPCKEGFYCAKWDGNSFGRCKAVVRRLRFNSFF